MSDDGVVRTAEVKTKSGTMMRPVAKFARLLEENAELPLKNSVSVPEDGNEHGAGNVPHAHR